MNLKHLLILLALWICQASFAQQREHTVARGETLASIAKKYGLTEEQLKAANPNMTMCFAGVRLVIPDPNAPVAASTDAKDDDTADSSSDKKDKASDAPKDSTKKKSLGNFLKSAGKSIGKAAKVAGNVVTAVAVSKVKGESWYDAINNAIESADSTISGGTNEHGIASLLSTKESKKKKRRETIKEVVDDDDDKDDGKAKDDINALTEVKKMDPELEAMYNDYKAKYDDFCAQVDKLKSVYTKANTVAKTRTWKNVSDAVKGFKTQLEKLREECEMYTGKEIVKSDLESWVPIAPKGNKK